MSKKKKKSNKKNPQQQQKKKKTHKKQNYTTIYIFTALILLVALITGIVWYVQNKDLLDKDKIYYADIEIKDYGKITVQLDQHSAPISAANFVKLAQEGFYNGTTFHRIIEGFMMQGGAPKEGEPEAKNIKGEFSENGIQNPLKHTRGVISMARAEDMNSANSQFFIMHETSSHLDGKYAAFGWVTEGMDVVDAVCTESEPTDGNGSIAKLKQPVIISINICVVDAK